MNTKHTLFAALLTTLTINVCSAMDYDSNVTPRSVKVVSTSMGEVYTDADGMTLYTFTKDGESKSNCNGGCAANWPPLTASTYAKEIGDFSVISRDDGTKQWAYKNAPLYLWVADKKQGDITGHGVQNVWFAAAVSE